MYNLLDGSWNQMIIGVYHKEQFIFAVLHASIHGTLLAAVFLMDIGDWHPFFGLPFMHQTCRIVCGAVIDHQPGKILGGLHTRLS